jgi:hypothetical protein
MTYFKVLFEIKVLLSAVEKAAAPYKVLVTEVVPSF